MKHTVRFRPEIPSDIAEACHWYESRSAGLGERFLRELKSTISRIAETPDAYGKGYRGLRSARMRRFPYVVHFLYADTEVIIVAVMYGGINPSIWEARL